MAISLFIDHSDNEFLKVSTSSFQYQVTVDPNTLDQWVFRYDYLRKPSGSNHPAAHLQINASLNLEGVLPAHRPLSRIHFATRRIPLEAVIGVLADEFGVECAESPDTWRPVLRAAGTAFAAIAHDPSFGSDPPNVSV